MSNGRHAPGKGSYQRQEPIYNVDVPTPTHGERALTLVANERTGTLSTLTRKPEGHPYGSFVTYALWEGNPIFLISSLAEHTQNLQGDPRCSLLVAEAGAGDPLALGRVTMVGQGKRLEDDTHIARAREVYLEANPNASYYADFKDFSWWRLELESIRYIGGYGRMSWVESGDWFEAKPDPIQKIADGIISHMNEDHEDAMIAYCRAFTQAKEVNSVRMTGVDQYGFEMSVQTEQGPRPARLAFSEAVSSGMEIRNEMKRLAKESRALLDGK